MSEELTRSGEGLFKPSRRGGYDRDEVDAYVSQLQRQVRELQTRQQTPDAAVREALERVGDEVADVLKQAHDTAEQIVSSARREAQEHVSKAQREAAHVVSVAEQRLHDLDLDTDRIWGERERIVADARDLARQLNQIADLAAERFPQDDEQRTIAAGGLGRDAEQMAGVDELNASH
jgi:cell division septum initiation protein DivIVA